LQDGDIVVHKTDNLLEFRVRHDVAHRRENYRPRAAHRNGLKPAAYWTLVLAEEKRGAT
jgi:hypothetical protein